MRPLAEYHGLAIALVACVVRDDVEGMDQLTAELAANGFRLSDLVFALTAVGADLVTATSRATGVDADLILEQLGLAAAQVPT